jgi:hypothetical protein
MAGTLTVQNLQGPASGSNANKVIIPSGQTLDASGGTLVPSAGAVVQIAEPPSTWSSRWSSSSTSFVQTPHYVDITPKYDDSKILITGMINGGHTTSGDYTRLLIIRNVGGTRTNVDENAGSSGGTAVIGQGAWHSAALHIMDSPNTTSSITYELWACSYTGTTASYLGWSTVMPDHNGVYITAAEIKQ